MRGDSVEQQPQSHHVERRVRQRKTTATAPVLDKRTQLVTVYV